ncbi:MAG TPA: hypothetical protein VK488_09615 [Gaiellaceae bacterium]|nr:hypothetical protein [Gaiellaceae bacterium]
MSRQPPDSLVSRRALRWAVIAGVAAASFTTVSLAFAGFNSAASGGPGTYASKRIFPGIRTSSAWTLRDASGGGAETNADDTLSYTDALLKTTGNWATTFSSTRYVEFDFNSARPGGVAVSSATFAYRMAANSAGDTACFYFEVYRASSSTLIGTHGSTGVPVACNATTTQTTYSTTLAEVTDTTILNDLRVRVYAKESGSRPMKQDLASVTGSTAYGSFTTYEKIYRDQSTGTPATTNWSVATSGDSTAYVSAGNWATTFAAARYMKFTFDPHVPSGSVITSASVDFYYKNNTAGDTVCWYFETYNGATLLGTHGSSGSPVSCNSTAGFTTDNVTLAELTSVTDANNLTIKVYMKDSTGARKSQTDLVQLNINHYLD